MRSLCGWNKPVNVKHLTQRTNHGTLHDGQFPTLILKTACSLNWGHGGSWGRGHSSWPCISDSPEESAFFVGWCWCWGYTHFTCYHSISFLHSIHPAARHLLSHISINSALPLTCESQLCLLCWAICSAEGVSSSFIFCFLGLKECLSILGKCFISIVQVCVKSRVDQRGNLNAQWHGNVGFGWDLVCWSKKQDSWTWNITVEKVLIHP